MQHSLFYHCDNHMKFIMMTDDCIAEQLKLMIISDDSHDMTENSTILKIDEIKINMKKFIINESFNHVDVLKSTVKNENLVFSEAIMIQTFNDDNVFIKDKKKKMH